MHHGRRYLKYYVRHRMRMFAMLLAVVLLYLFLWFLFEGAPSQPRSLDSGEEVGLQDRPLLESISTGSSFQPPLVVVHGVCEWIPQASLATVWNRLVRHAANGAVGHTTDLRRGIRTRPRISYWRELLDKVQSKVAKQQESTPVTMVLLVPFLVSDEQVDRIRELLDQKLAYWSLGWGSPGWKLTYRIHPVQNLNDLGITLLSDAEIVIDATGASGVTQDYYVSAEESVWKTTSMTPDYQDDLRAQKQPWIRRFLLPDPSTVKVPSLILLDGLLPVELGAWNAMLATRTLQELADWYQIPFLSVASIVQPMKYQQSYLPMLQTFKDRSEDINDSMAPTLLQFDLTLDLLVFAALDFTIALCQSPLPSTRPLPILKDGVEYLAEYVIPPPLDPSLSLRQVSEEWRHAANMDSTRKSQ